MYRQRLSPYRDFANSIQTDTVGEITITQQKLPAHRIMVERDRTNILFLSGLTTRGEQVLPHRFCFRPLQRLRQQCPAVFEARATLNRLSLWVWLTDVLECTVSGRIKAHELERLLPWAWEAEQSAATANA